MLKRTMSPDDIRRLLIEARSVSTPLVRRLQVLDEVLEHRRTLDDDERARLDAAAAELVAELESAGPTSSNALTYRVEGGRIRRSVLMG